MDRLYQYLFDEEDARVCKDIPDESCREVPRNFFKIGIAQTLTKLADELSNAKTVLPWLLGALLQGFSLAGVAVAASFMQGAGARAAPTTWLWATR